MARRNKLRKNVRGKKGGAGRTFLLILIGLILTALAAGGFILFEREKPTVTLAEKIAYLGGEVTLPLHAEDQKSGIRSVVMTLEQGDKSMQLFARLFQRKAWFSTAGPTVLDESVVLDAKKSGAKDGKAELVIVARDFSLNGVLKGNEHITRIPVIIDTKPPQVSVQHAQPYIRPGGSGIVVYHLSEAAAKHGVMLDELFFPGFPLAGKKDLFIAYIALPWNASPPESTKVIAEDQAGNQGKAVFMSSFKNVPEVHDRINISDGFLKRKIPEFETHYPDLSGGLLDKFLFVNNTVRQHNAQAIKNFCRQPSPEKMWEDRFLRMPGAKRAGFADQRTYNYNGKSIDHQTHLGMDIASTAQVPIKAANHGKVAMAEYLGIYGNTVILDHGQGVFSLYSHLSRIDTSIGALVQKDQLIGHSGLSGMAGGDHLHFSMLVHGIFVTPVEWWDQHWIDVNINDILSGRL